MTSVRDAALARIDATVLDRARGCLLAGAIGDALGWPVEFAAWDAITHTYGPSGVTGLPDVAVAEITDDTQMTAFTAEALVLAATRSSTDWTGLGWQSYRRWFAAQASAPFAQACEDLGVPDGGWLPGLPAIGASRAPGLTCLSALARVQPGTVARPANDSKGCGGVMRTAPVGFLPEGEDHFEVGAALAAVTHGHPLGYLTGGALAQMVHDQVSGTSLTFAVSRAQARLEVEPGGQEAADLLGRARILARTRPGSRDALTELGEGWVGEEALAISVYAALSHPQDLRAALLLAVNHSGDSDSTGAICGNILGAALGVGAIPAEWADRVELGAEMQALAEDVVLVHRASPGPLDYLTRRYPA